MKPHKLVNTINKGKFRLEIHLSIMTKAVLKMLFLNMNGVNPHTSPIWQEVAFIFFLFLQLGETTTCDFPRDHIATVDRSRIYYPRQLAAEPTLQPCCASHERGLSLTFLGHHLCVYISNLRCHLLWSPYHYQTLGICSAVYSSPIPFPNFLRDIQNLIFSLE